MQIKTTMRYHFTAVRTTTIKKTTSSSFTSWKMAGEKAEKPIRRREKLRQRRLILVAKLKRLRSAAEILSWSEELADTPNRLCIPERPCTKGSIQQRNPSWKEKEAEGSCYCHKTSWWWQECVCMLNCFRPVCLFATLWTGAHQAPLSIGFSRQEYWNGLPSPSLGDLPAPGIEPTSPALQADSLPSETPGKPKNGVSQVIKLRKMPRYYLTEDGPWKLLSWQKPFSSMWENCTLASLLGPFRVSSLNAAKVRGCFPKAGEHWLATCDSVFPLNRVPGYKTKFVIATSTKTDIRGVKAPEHLTDVYFEKKGTSLAIWWLGLHTSPAGGTGLIHGQESKILQAQWRGQKKKNYISQAPGRWDLWWGEKEVKNYRAVPGWSESCGLTDSAKSQSCSSAPGLPPLCVCSHK